MEAGGEAMGGSLEGVSGLTYLEGRGGLDYHVCSVCQGSTAWMTWDVARKRLLCELCFSAWLAR
jgi:hypothetical protein